MFGMQAFSALPERKKEKTRRVFVSQFLGALFVLQ